MLPRVICNIIAEYTITYEIQLLDWIDIDKIDWKILSRNPNAIDLLTANQDKINWYCLSSNPSIFTKNTAKYNTDVSQLTDLLCI